VTGASPSAEPRPSALSYSPRIPAYLRKSRHGIYYFRMAVPRALQEKWSGRTEIKRSLGTKDPRQALLLARNLAICFVEQFTTKQESTSVLSLQPHSKSTLSVPWIHQFEKTVVTVLPDGTREELHIKADPNSHQDVAAARFEFARDQQRIRMLRQPHSQEAQAYFEAEEAEIRKELERAQRLQELAIEQEEARLAQIKASAPVAVATPLRERVESPRPLLDKSQVLLPAQPAKPRREDLSNAQARAEYDKKKLSTLWYRYLRLKMKEGLDGKSVGTYQMKFDTFLDWYGDTHVEDVTPEDISDYKDYLLHDMTVRAGRKRGQVGLDTPTVDNYVGVINGLFKWAQRGGLYPRQMLLPTTEQRITSKASKKARAQAGKANRAFKSHELNTAFDPKHYKENNRHAHHFWPPLIALFTGMRLGEVSQLACDDVRQEDGVWVIDVNDEDYKKVKTAAARRLIPMHPELVRLGLPEFVQDVRALGLGSQLFPALIPKEDGSIGNAPGKKWDLYLKAAGLMDDALTFHSLRRTANTLLKKARVPFDVRCQMVGHDLDHVNEFYATEYSVGDLADMVLPKFIYEGLDLSPLTYHRHEYDEAIRKAHESGTEESRKRIKERDQKLLEKQSSSAPPTV
jgi:integrase